MSNPRDIAEPSMEEILSSIRRIIAADEDGGAKPTPPVASGLPGLRREPPRAEPEPSNAAAADAAPPSAPDDPGNSTAVLEDEDAAEDGEPDDVLELTTLVEEGAAPGTLSPTPAVEPPDAVTSAPSAETSPAEPTPIGSEPGLRRQPAPPHEKETQPVSTATTTANGKTDEIVSGSAAAATADAFGKLSQSLRPPTENAGPITGDQRRLEDIVVEALRPMLKSWLDEHLPAIVDRLVQQEISKMARRAELM